MAKKSLSHFLAGALLLSALTVTTATTAKAATVGTGACEQTVGSNVGVSVIQDGNDCVITFTTGSTTWTPATGVTSVRALVIGGGGGGGAWVGGGGGAGGFRDVSSVSVTPGTPVSLSVGAGGTPAIALTNATYTQFGTNGGDSTFGSVTATGGGKGASHASGGLGGVDRKALSGGSGGGGTGSSGATNDDWPMVLAGGAGNTPSTTPAQGSNGGAGFGGLNFYTTGGGGGATSAGGAGISTAGGNGGAGASSDITGSTVFYAGGGGGVDYENDTTHGTGGIGGGGAGNVVEAATSGSANTGGGGGGHGSYGGTSTGGSGGSGVVIIRYATTPAPQSTPTSTASPSSAPSTSTPAAVATKSTANLGKSIRFSTSSKVLTTAHKNALKKSVKASGKDATYVVTGTAGFLPGVTEAQVKKLAKVRANIVKAYLVKLGVNQANITMKLKTTNQGIIPKTKTLASYITS